MQYLNIQGTKPMSIQVLNLKAGHTSYESKVA